MANLRFVISRIRNNQADASAWLYLAGAVADITLETEANLGQPELEDDSDNEIDPVGFAQRGLRSTIDVETVRDCLAWAERLAHSTDDGAAVDVIRYYIRFDAFPEALNPPDPPPADEVLRRLDQAFCDKLGPEDPSTKCRRDGCNRGSLERSLLCRRHHFETVQKRPYPFNDRGPANLRRQHWPGVRTVRARVPVGRLAAAEYMSPENRLVERGRLPDGSGFKTVVEKENERCSLVSPHRGCTAPASRPSHLQSRDRVQGGSR